MFVDLRALRHDRVTLVERGSPHSLSLMESGKLLPGVRPENIFLFVLQQLKILSPGERDHRGPRDPGPVRGQQPRGDLGGGTTSPINRLHHYSWSVCSVPTTPAVTTPSSVRLTAATQTTLQPGELNNLSSFSVQGCFSHRYYY